MMNMKLLEVVTPQSIYREDKVYNPPNKNILIQTWKTRSNKCSVFAQLCTLAQKNKEGYTQISAEVSPPHQVGGTNTSMQCMCMTVIQY